MEQDGLLRRDIVTVSEASTLAKNAVLLSIKTIAELVAVGLVLYAFFCRFKMLFGR